MRVGVCLGDFIPKAGGGYTFVSQVYEAFLEAAPHTPDDFVVFGRAAFSATHAANCTFHALPAIGTAAKVVAAAKSSIPLFSLLYRRPGILERAALERGIELLWFVGGMFYDVPDIPYVATVWDLQHRTHPWFPEVAAAGQWDRREAGYARYLRRAAYVITGTKVGAAQIQAFYQVPAERIRILPHPTPAMPAQETEPPVPGLAARRFIFYPAQFWPHKNHVNLLHAVKIIRDESALDLHLVLTGTDKGNLQHVRSVIDRLGLTQVVHNLGFVDRETLVWLYRRAVALAYPSFSGPENLPPLEANALGCAVAIADYPGAREQLADAALYFDPSDPASIAAALRDLVACPHMADELKAKGLANAASRTAARYVEGVLSVVREFEAVRRCWS